MVDDYVVALRHHWDNNGNTFPESIKVSAMRSIERVAMDLAVRGMEKKLMHKDKITKH